jgi:hypothetical protein
MSIDIDGILSATSSHAQALGVFGAVMTHEPKSVLANMHSCAIWVDKIRGVPNRGGLATTSVLLVLMVRMYQSMTFEPMDVIDPNLVKTADLLMAAYTSDFTFGLAEVEIDLLGVHGGGMLEAQGGYIDIDGKMNRVFDLTVPLVINDVWNQVR